VIPQELGGVRGKPHMLDYEFSPEVAPARGVNILDQRIDYSQPDVPTVSEAEAFFNERHFGS